MAALSDDAPQDLPSPCVAVCVLSPETGFCHGCFRDINEIARWTVMPPTERLAVLGRLAEREAADIARRQARRAARAADRAD